MCGRTTTYDRENVVPGKNFFLLKLDQNVWTNNDVRQTTDKAYTISSHCEPIAQVCLNVQSKLYHIHLRKPRLPSPLRSLT